MQCSLDDDDDTVAVHPYGCGIPIWHSGVHIPNALTVAIFHSTWYWCAECFADWSIDWVIDNGANEIQLSGSFTFPYVPRSPSRACSCSSSCTRSRSRSRSSPRLITRQRWQKEIKANMVRVCSKFWTSHVVGFYSTKGYLLYYNRNFLFYLFFIRSAATQGKEDCDYSLRAAINLTICLVQTHTHTHTVCGNTQSV